MSVESVVLVLKMCIFEVAMFWQVSVYLARKSDETNRHESGKLKKVMNWD